MRPPTRARTPTPTADDDHAAGLYAQDHLRTPDRDEVALRSPSGTKMNRWILAALAAVLLAVFLPLTQGRDTACAAQPAMRESPGDVITRTPRPIEGIDSIWIEELTWMEVRDELARGKTIGIIPTGGVEQNGPYLAGGKHNYVVQAVCEAVARELGNALCAPVMKYVPQGDPEAIRYPGTLSLREETFRMVLADAATSLKSQGFTDIVFIGDSAGNQNGMAKTARTLDERWRGAARAHYIGEYYREDIWSCEYLKAQLNIFQQPDICSAVRGPYHDDVHYSSIVAVTSPRHIRARQRIEAGLYSINGVELGPIERTVEIGRRLIEYRTAITARAIRKRLDAARRTPR